MEFFKIVDKCTTETIIQKKISPKNIEIFNGSMFLIEEAEKGFSCGTIWGEFLVSYDKIKGGVRFALIDCPNALQWTITTGYPPKTNKIVLHLTINRNQITGEFNEEIQAFLEEWCTGLNNSF